MVKAPTETEITSQVEQMLQRNLAEAGSALRLSQLQTEQSVGKAVVDALAKIRIPGPKQESAILLIEVKSRGEPSYLSQAITQLKSYRDAAESKFGKKREIGLLVAAPFISERGRELCTKQGVGYMDFAGNFRLRLGNHSIDKLGRQNPSRGSQEIRTLFSPKSSRLLRALLIEPNRQWTLSELANETNVSLGLAHKLVKKLENELFTSRGKDNRLSLDKPGELLDSWASHYRITEHDINDYYSFQRNPSSLIKQVSQVAKAHNLDYALTLHAGASLVAPFTRFNETQMYVPKKNLNDWADRLDLRPVERGGNVQLIVPKDEGVLYGKQIVDGLVVVSTVQLYLDLIGHPARGREQADFLRKEKLTV